MSNKRDMIGAFLSALLGFWLASQLTATTPWRVAVILFLVSTVIIFLQRSTRLNVHIERLKAHAFVFVGTLAISQFIAFLLNPGDMTIGRLLNEPNFWMLTLIVLSIIVSLEVNERT